MPTHEFVLDEDAGLVRLPGGLTFRERGRAPAAAAPCQTLSRRIRDDLREIRANHEIEQIGFALREAIEGERLMRALAKPRGREAR